MNAGAARACRADRRLTGRGGKVPREMKLAWAALTTKERGILRRKWRGAQHELGEIGEFKHRQHLARLAAAVKPADINL